MNNNVSNEDLQVTQKVEFSTLLSKPQKVLKKQFDDLEQTIEAIPELPTKKQRLNLLKLSKKIRSLVKRKNR